MSQSNKAFQRVNPIDPSLVKVSESPEAALLAPNVVGREAVVAAALDVQGREVQPEVNAGILPTTSSSSLN